MKLAFIGLGTMGGAMAAGVSPRIPAQPLQDALKE